MNALLLVWIRIAIYTLVSLGVAWNTTMSDVVWDSMTWEQKSCVIGGIVVLWLNSMASYFDKSLWKYDESKKNGNGNGTTKTTL